MRNDRQSSPNEFTASNEESAPSAPEDSAILIKRMIANYQAIADPEVRRTIRQLIETLSKMQAREQDLPPRK